MANEKRLIDANALISEHGNDITNWDKPCAVYIASIENAPTVDAVEVVRCKDCKHMSECRGETLCDNPMGIFGRNTADDFCSHGERREGE